MSVTLDQPPRTAALLAKAILTSRRRRGGDAGLPFRRLVLPGVEQDTDKLAAYADVCGLTLRDQVPASWLHVVTFPLQLQLMAARDFPFPMIGMVHVANTMTVHRPVLVGETLTLSAYADHLTPHAKGVTVDLIGQVRVSEEVVWTGASTYLARGASMGGQEDARPGGEADGETGAAVVRAGELPDLAIWRLRADLGRRYAAVSGDVNPIHVSGLAARAFGFPRAIAHGMWTHARMLGAIEGRLPERHTVRVSFRKPVLLPSTVLARARPDGAGWDLAVTSQDGSRTHLEGRVEPIS